MLLLVEGFEGYGTTVGLAPRPSNAVARFYSVSNEASMDVEAGRLSGYSIEYAATDCRLGAGGLTTNDTLIVGVGVRFSVSNWSAFLTLFDNTTQGMTLRVSTTGQIRVYRGTTSLAQSAVGVITFGAWHYIEFKVKCNGSTGTYEVRVGGVVVVSASGVNTKAGSNDYHDRVRLTFEFGTGTVRFDDWYVCDSTGSVNNDFLGNCRIVAVFPDGDDVAGWDTASGAGDHYLDVDENPMDDDATYVEDATTGHKDLYDYTAMEAGLGAIKGLVIKTTCRETDAENFDLVTPIKSGVTEDDDSAQAIGTTDFTTKVRISETDPNTASAWIGSDVDAAKFGVKVG